MPLARPLQQAEAMTHLRDIKALQAIFDVIPNPVLVKDRDHRFVSSDEGTKMRPKALSAKATPGERLVKDIRRATRRQFSAEEKIRIVLDGAVSLMRTRLHTMESAL